MRPKNDELVDIFLDLYPGPFAMLTACFDESTQEKGKVFCVSGILLDRKNLKAFDREWKLELKLAGVPHYHAVDCAHGRGAFTNRSKEFRMAMHKRMCEIMEKRVVCSMTVVSFRWDYQFKKEDWGFSEYTTCAFMCLDELLDFARTMGFNDNLTVFIEYGNAKMGEFRDLLKSQIRKGRDDISHHLFCGKDGFRAVQAADVLAYEVCKRLADKSQEPDKVPTKHFRKSAQTITGFGRDKGQLHRYTFLCERERLAFPKRLQS